jgi:hypothetical protein
MYVATLSSLVLLYCVIYLTHSSNFTSYVADNRKNLHIPKFIHSYLIKIACEVRSQSKITSWVSGILEPQTSADDVFRIIKDLSLDDWKILLKDASFCNKLAYDKRNLLEFKSHIDDICMKLLIMNDDDKYDYYLAFFSQLLTCHYSEADLPYYEGFLEFSLSSHIGIYRFRSGSGSGIYLANKPSLDAVTEESLIQFACFLRLMEPSFVCRLDDTLVSTLLPGDQMFSVGHLPLEDAWRKYISSNITSTRVDTNPRSIPVELKPTKSDLGTVNKDEKKSKVKDSILVKFSDDLTLILTSKFINMMLCSAFSSRLTGVNNDFNAVEVSVPTSVEDSLLL